jgi:VanZ family protein
MAKKFISLYLPPLIWMGVIFMLSSVPHLQATSNPFWNFVTRKSAHIFEYFVLSLLIYRAIGYKRAYLAILLTLLYAASDEYHQSFVPQRTGALSDIIYDLSGILLGVYFRYRKYRGSTHG